MKISISFRIFLLIKPYLVDCISFSDQVNDKCHDLDKDEQTKCEAHYLGIHGEGPEYEV